jgi:hypothetical protein
MLDPVGENFRLKFWPQCSLIRSVQFYHRNPGLSLDPGSTNSSRISPQDITLGAEHCFSQIVCLIPESEVLPL